MVRFLGQDVHFPQGYGPRRDAACWFTPGVICSGGEAHTHTHTHTHISLVKYTFMQHSLV